MLDFIWNFLFGGGDNSGDDYVEPQRIFDRY